MTTVWILESQPTEHYTPNKINHLYGVFTSPDNALDALNHYLTDIADPVVWESIDVNVASGEVFRAVSDVQIFSKIHTHYFYLVPMTLDFGVPEKES